MHVVSIFMNEYKSVAKGLEAETLDGRSLTIVFEAFSISCEPLVHSEKGGLY